MYTHAQSSSLLADRSVTFTVVVVFHLALGYAFVSGLTTQFVNHLVDPIVLQPVREQSRPEVMPPVSRIPVDPIVVNDPENPQFFEQGEEGPRTVTPPPTGGTADLTPTVPAAPTLTPVRMDPRHPLKIGAEHYPDSAVRLGQEGRCVVNLTVAEDGRIADFALQSSSGFEALDAACLRAVRGQRMLPALQDGKPVRSRAAIPIVWKLESR